MKYFLHFPFSGKSAITDAILMEKIYDEVMPKNQNTPSWTMAHQKFLNERLEEYLRIDNEFDPSFVTKLYENSRMSFAGKSSITDECLFQKIQETINRLN